MAEGGTGTGSSKEKLNTGGDQKRISGDGGISSNTVEVQGLSTDTSQEVVEMYFENSRRSGGGDIEEVQIKDGKAYITFVEAETAQRVVSHSSHQVAGQTLNVTLYHPPPTKPCYDNRVLVQELNSAVTEELLANFLMRETGAKVTEILYGEEAGRVVVTFSSCIDFDALRKVCRETRIKGTFLQVARVTISNCILVWNLQLSSSCDVILLYFENKRRSGGGDVEKVEMLPEERYCLVYFEDNTVIDRVLSQTHKIDGAAVKVHLHHECLGRRSSANRSLLCFKISNTGNKDTASLDNTPAEISIKETSSSMSSDHEKESDFVQVPEWQINDGRDCVLFLLVQYRKTHGTKIVRDIKKVQCSLQFLSFWNFYTRKKQGQQMLNEILQTHCCSVTVSSEMDDMFLFEVNSTCFEKESDFEDFLNVVLCSVYKCAQQSLFSDAILFDHRLQEDVQQRVNQSQELDCAWIKLIGEHGTDGMCIVCTDKNKMAVLHHVTEIIADAKKCFENHEEVVFVDVMWHRVMTKFEYVKNISNKFPNLTVTTVETKPSFMLKGLRDDSKAAAANLTKLLETAQMEVQEDIFSPGCHFEILTYPAMHDYIDNCIALPSINFIWMPNPQTKNVHIFYRKSEVVRGLGKLIKACIKEKAYVFAKEDDMIKVEKSKSVQDLEDKYKGRTMIHATERDTLVVTAADDIFESVDAGIQEIIKNVRSQSSQSACPPEKLITQPYLKVSKSLNEKEELHLRKENVLEETFQESAISAADEMKMPRLAGLPSDLCAQQYCRAVDKFSKQAESPLKLQEVNFVDNNKDMIQVKQSTFAKYLSSQKTNFPGSSVSGSQLYTSFVPQLKEKEMVHTEYSSMPTGKASYSDETNAANVSPGTGRKGGDGIFYYLNEKTAIKVIIGDICDIMADAIVSIEDENGSGKASVAKAIFKVAGSRYIEFEHSKVKMAKKSITDIVVTGAGQLKCQFVLHAIAPEWSLEAKRENQTFRKNVTRTMLNIMDAAFEKKLKSFAVPLIGTSTDDKHKELLTTCSEAMIDGLHQWIKSHSQKYQFDTVMLICSNEVAFQCIADLLHAKLENKGIEKGRLKRETLSKPSDFQSKLDAYTTKLSDSGSKEDCVICMETITDPKVLPKCGHTFCKECIHQQFKYKPVCPCCGVVYGKITGVQPDGTMKIFYEKDSLPGFEKCGTIIIFYEFNGGTQKEEHPHPGRPYSGTKRKAYLPDNDRGRFVLKLLREAFKRRLVFTIGTSRTTVQDDTVIWNDIHHKTNRVGGPQNFGYPDATYLDRVTEELAVKEVTEESLE